MTATAAKPQSRDGALTHRQVMTILTGLLLGMFLAALDQTIVATAIRRIGDDLNGLSAQAWVTTAFLITSTITTPLYGKLSDIYGRKPLFLIAIVIFIAGSALCGLATSMYMLAAFRAFQGIGAGGLFSLALAILADIVSPQDRPRYMGYFMAVFATSSVLGPVIGGFLSGQDSIFGVTGWRWIFYVNVPIGLVALVVVNRVLRIPHTRRDHGIDWQGALMLVIGLVPLLIIAEQGREWGWGSAAAWACYLIGLAGLIAFVWVEDRMGDEALIPLRLFRSGPFSVGAAQSFVIGIGMFGGIASIPLYLQIVKGASPTKAGLLILPMVLGIMVAVNDRRADHLAYRQVQEVPDHGRLRVGDRHVPAVDRRRRHVLVADRPLHGAVRRGPGPEHADHPARHAELGATARHRSGYLVGHVLPPGRRHDGHRGVPVHPVLSRAAQDRLAVHRGARDARVPGGGSGASGSDQAACRAAPAASTTRRSCSGSIM